MRTDQVSATASNSEHTRLHITPFNASLLPTIVNPSLLQSASDISYHTVQTFPEADYGYIELPSADAKKLQSKLHGSILRGRKVRVEPALSLKWPAGVPSEEELGLRNDQRRVDSNHRPDKDLVLSGVFLDSRRIQRGWTKASLSTKQATKGTGDMKGSNSASKIKTECLFRTRLPPNAVPLENSAKTKKGQKRRTSDGRRDVLIREFSSTTKYSTFLKENNQLPTKKCVSEYVDGKGWVDEEGNIVEAVTGRQERQLQRVTSDVKSHKADDSNEDHASGSHHNHMDRKDSRAGSPMIETEISTSSSEAEETSPSEAEDTTMAYLAATKKLKVAKEPQASKASTAHQRAQDTSQPDSPVGNRLQTGLTITIPSNPNKLTPIKTSDGRDVHPLEAIFKRPAMRARITSATNVTVETEQRPFSFFEEDPETTSTAGHPIPQTPFTQQDFQRRGIRSAAPTPDTAAPGKRFSFWGEEDDDDEVEEQEQEDDDGMKEGRKSHQLPETDVSPESAIVTDDVVVVSSSGGGQPGGEKGFEELFWERRGETNRAWKRRRRETGKYKRKTENKRLATQNI